MGFIKALSSSFLLKIIFSISLFILIFLASISYKHSVALAESTTWVMQSYKINIYLEQLFSYVKDAESGQRGFMVTHDSAYLLPYFNASIKFKECISELEKLCSNNKQQIIHLEKLKTTIKDRFSHLDSALKVTGKDSAHTLIQYANVKTGNSIMDTINFQIKRMIALEKENLTKQQSYYKEDVYIGQIIILFFLLFAFLVLIFSYWKINSDLVNLTNANARLMVTNEATRQAEEIGAFSSWQWDLETNKVSYSDNQYLLLGWKPQSFEPTMEKFLGFVHPDDRHIITDGAQNFMKTGSNPVASFRIIRKNGDVRFYKSLSKVVIQEDGKRTLIGVNKDVTEYHISQVTLEERNRELELKNKELASFNQVASHDLQEPLRIVQTYISRFNEKETGFLTIKGKEYFSKIKIAITRMRTLIDDLLLFSRVSAMDKIFESADLNCLLERSKQDFAQVIEDKGIAIHADDLPTLKVIPFQIQQLFNNLISNSIKYRRTNMPLKIRIACDKEHAVSHPEYMNGSKKTFYKISFVDNGMGFDQSFAHEIFGLFHRLHHEKEYPGTGIGLSICQKIAEKHGGFIKAEGKPGEGANFSIFLPC